MSKPGPRPRPTALKLLHGETRPSRVNRNEPKPGIRRPTCPSWFDADTKRVWRQVCKELEEMGILRAADGPMIEVYVSAIVAFRGATSMLQETGALIKGARGGLVKNPLTQVARDNAQLIAKCAAEFGLTPSSRSGIEVAPLDDDDDIARRYLT